MGIISNHYGKTDAKILMDNTSQLNSRKIRQIVDSLVMNVTSWNKIESGSNRCIQVADFVAGSIFAKYEHNNSDYYDKLTILEYIEI